MAGRSSRPTKVRVFEIGTRYRFTMLLAQSNLPINANTSTVLGIGILVLAVIAIIGVFVVIVVASRSEPDESGRRPYSVYLFGVAFVTLFTALFATFAMVDGVVQLIGTHPGVNDTASIHPVGDAVVRQVVLGGVLLLVAGSTLALHLRAGFRSADGAPWPHSAAGRIAQTYISAVLFVSVITMVVAAVVAIYAVFQVVAPGVFRVAGGRVLPARTLIAAGYLSLAAGGILLIHLRRAPEPLRRLLRPRGGDSPQPSPV